MVNIMKNINKKELENIIKNLSNEQAIFLKFSAEWCGPCKLIKKEYDELISICSSNIICIDIDIDESIELFTFFKKEKLLKGVPAMYIFHGNKDKSNDTKWYLPDYSLLGADKSEFNIFATILSKYIITNNSY